MKSPQGSEAPLTHIGFYFQSYRRNPACFRFGSHHPNGGVEGLVPPLVFVFCFGHTPPGFIDLDGTFFAEPAKGQRGRGRGDKTPVLLMVESKGGYAGSIAIQTVPSMALLQIGPAVRDHNARRHKIQTDGSTSYAGLNYMGHRHDGSPVPAENASEVLPRLHTAISNGKRFLLGTSRA